jgi:proteasome accessory factor A
LKELVGPQTTYDRPLVNSRDESLDADPDRLARLHVVAFDANVSELAEYLKLGLLQLLCAAIDLGHTKVTTELSDPLSAIRSVARDPWAPLQMASGKTITPCEILGRHLDAFEAMNRDGYLEAKVPDAKTILRCATEVLTQLERDPLELCGVLDWPTKFAWLEGIREQHDLSWSDPRLKWLDCQYHRLTGGEGLPVPLRRVTRDERIRSLAVRPPGESRAALRGQLIRRFGKEICTADWAWIAPEGDEAVYWLPDDPEPGVFRKLESAKSLDEAARSLGLEADRLVWEFVLPCTGPRDTERKCDSVSAIRPKEMRNA